jgi:hypothetical protein
MYLRSTGESTNFSIKLFAQLLKEDKAAVTRGARQSIVMEIQVAKKVSSLENHRLL